jgi:hypothetical protein
MRRASIYVFAAAFAAATLAAWIYTEVAPEKLGVCHEVALYIGSKPTVRDCQPLEAAWFAIPIGLLAVLVPLLLSWSGDAEVVIPFFGKNIEVRRANKAAEVLAERPPIAERGSEWLQTLEDGSPDT